MVGGWLGGGASYWVATVGGELGREPSVDGVFYDAFDKLYAGTSLHDAVRWLRPTPHCLSRPSCGCDGWRRVEQRHLSAIAQR